MTKFASIRRTRLSSKCGYVGRVFSPLGNYPKDSILASDGVLICDDDFTFSIVHYDIEFEGANGYTEMDWASHTEIAFFASIALAGHGNCRMLTLYPLRTGYYFQGVRSERLTQPSTIKRCKEIMLTDLANSTAWEARHVLMPTVISKERYGRCPGNLDELLQNDISSAIDPADALLIRGLSTWLRSAMIMQHSQFTEEAVMTMFVSMEASFQLLQRQFVVNGQPKPDAKTVGNFLAKVFNEDPWEGYFAEHYENRIKSIHPDSRFGVYSYPPLQADDYYHLRESLRCVYIYLLTGRVQIHGD
jgi:hypothetical protein